MSRTDLSRLAEKACADRDALDGLLDEVWLGHVGVVRDGLPAVFPTAIARCEDRVLFHGSTGSPWLRAVAAGAPICLSVTAVDALVVARSAFESSVRYRSAMVYGVATGLTGEERTAALDALTDRLLPGRVPEIRRSTARELAATQVLALPLEEWSLKISDGWPEDSDEDVAGGAWAGVVPVLQRYGVPVPAPDLRSGIPVPPSVAGLGGTG